MTMTLPEEALLDWLDFAPSCSFSGCAHAADWWLVCRACNSHAPVCEPHRRREVLDVAIGDPFRRVVCPRCLEGVQVRQWARLFEFVPIGGA